MNKMRNIYELVMVNEFKTKLYYENQFFFGINHGQKGTIITMDRLVVWVVCCLVRWFVRSFGDWFGGFV
jgi:hypothetical protein